MQTTPRLTEISDTSLSVDLIPVSTLDVPFFWVLAENHVLSVLDRFDHTDALSDIYQDLCGGHRQLWLVHKGGEVIASVLTMINEQHGKRYGAITHAGGHDAKEWFSIVNPIGDYFKQEGCKTFQIVGRKGWTKYLKDFRADKIILEKNLDG